MVRGDARLGRWRCWRKEEGSRDPAGGEPWNFAMPTRHVASSMHPLFPSLEVPSLPEDAPRL